MIFFGWGDGDCWGGWNASHGSGGATSIPASPPSQSRTFVPCQGKGEALLMCKHNTEPLTFPDARLIVDANLKIFFIISLMNLQSFLSRLCYT